MSMTSELPADPEVVPFSPTIALLALSRVAELELERVLRRRGLNIRKYGVLGHVARSPGLSLSEIGRRSGITVQSVHTLIGTLVSAGLIQSEIQTSGVAARICVTPSGVETMRLIATELIALDKMLFAADEMREVSRALLAATERRMGRHPHA